MLVSERTTYIRSLINTPGTNSNRWPESQLIAHVDRAQKSAVARVRFPDSRLSLTTTNTNQEYTMPDTHRIHRVYVNGQICAETPGNIDTIEGKQILYNDQTGQGALSTGSGAAPGGTQYLPQWAIQTPTAYPYANSFGPPAPMSQPYYPGQSPRYYRRGGWIGFIPAPTSGAILTIDCVLVPATLTGDSQVLAVPDNFADFIDAFVVHKCLMADRDPVARQIAMDYFNIAEQQIKELRTWKRDFSLEDSQVMLLPERAFFQIGGNTAGGGW